MFVTHHIHVHRDGKVGGGGGGGGGGRRCNLKSILVVVFVEVFNAILKACVGVGGGGGGG